ncbi:MAG: hypothetical protein M1835_001861 [Candelina submexicana]|nr:MAG: hypothetical protein M1835_001861 [Candelina submexicana]
MGPVGGRHTDIYLLHEFGLITRLRELWNDETRGIAYVYGDKGYRCNYGLIAAFQKPPLGALTLAQQTANHTMSRLRQDVEHGFGVERNL